MKIVFLTGDVVALLGGIFLMALLITIVAVALLKYTLKNTINNWWYVPIVLVLLTMLFYVVSGYVTSPQ